MLCLTLTLTTLGTWNYAGFMASRSEPPIESVANQIPPSSGMMPAHAAPHPGSPLTTTPHQGLSQPRQSQRTTTELVASTRPGVRYRLADTTGQLWEHSDPVWLQHFVQDRNQKLLRLSR